MLMSLFYRKYYVYRRFSPAIIEISECKSSPCINGGTCEDLHHGTQYRCICKPGFTGKNCQIGAFIKIFDSMSSRLLVHLLYDG